MIFKQHQTAATLHLECLTNITVSNASMFKLAVISLARDDVRAVELDLHRVQHLDSTGLCALIACRKVLRAAGIRLSLLNPQAHVRLLFGLTRTEPLFDLRGSAVPEMIGQQLESLSQFHAPQLPQLAF